MSVIVVNAEMKAKLLTAGMKVELRDEAGEFLGEFISADDASLYERPELDISMEEVARLLAPDRKTYSTPEVLEHLRGL